MFYNHIFITFCSALIISKLILVNSEDNIFDVTKTHPLYSEIECYYPKISSFTKLLDNIYFLSSTDGKYWYQQGINNPRPINAMLVSEINSGWSQIDTAFYISIDNECDFRFIKSMFLLRYNHNTGQNELLYRSLDTLNFTALSWSELTRLFDTRNLINWNKKVVITANNDSIYIFQDDINIRLDCVKKVRRYSINENFKINISGPFDWAYFEDSSEDIMPLYLVKQNDYFICHISKTKSNNITNCDQFELKHFPMIPKPFCWLKRYPNKDIFISLLTFLLIIFVFIIISSAYIYIYMGKQWKKLPIFQDKTEVKDENNIEIESQEKPEAPAEDLAKEKSKAKIE